MRNKMLLARQLPISTFVIVLLFADTSSVLHKHQYIKQYSIKGEKEETFKAGNKTLGRIQFDKEEVYAWRNEANLLGRLPEEEKGTMKIMHEKWHQNKPIIKFSGAQTARQKAVVGAFRHAWAGYKKYAWGYDMLQPVSRKGKTWLGMGLTIIDSLDTLVIMDLKEEFEEARLWVRDSLNLDIDMGVNVFETTIRVLGGLLSTYHLTGDKLFLEKAVDLGERLIKSFQNSHRLPCQEINLKTRMCTSNSQSVISEIGSIQLEFVALSRATGDPKYEKAVTDLAETIHTKARGRGIVPVALRRKDGEFTGNYVRMGGMADSYYEYLLKHWLQTGKTVQFLLEDFKTAISQMDAQLVRESFPSKLVFVGETRGGNFNPEMEELSCFLPGTLALAAQHVDSDRYLSLSRSLAYTCYQLASRQGTGLHPDVVTFNMDKAGREDFVNKDGKYLQRPETVESLWYLYYYTSNNTYQEWGWEMFQAVERFSRMEVAHSTLYDVARGVRGKWASDLMETYFLAETLKYFYLLFSEDQEIDLEKWVFNTEAHPLPVYQH